jgi:PAS domain S-box-containing protein
MADIFSRLTMFLTPIGIQKRTVTAILGAGLLVFALFCLGMVIYWRGLMQSRVDQFLTPYAQIIAVSAGPAVGAGDRVRAQQILTSLKSNPQVTRADIILADGRTLATYPPNNPPLERASWNRSDGVYMTPEAGEFVRHFSGGNSASAQVFLRMSLAVMKQRERQVLTEASLAVFMILGSFALLQFVLLRRWVLSPLAQLAGIAESAGQHGDYSRRMPAHDRDEFGQLGKNFNALLAAVEQREQGMARDLAERKQAEAGRRDVEEALHQQHSLLEAALQATADGILAVSSEGKITSYNRQFLELWHLPQETLDANNTTALAEFILKQLSHPAELEAHIRRFNDASKADTFDTLEFTDGRVYERFSRPQMVAGRVVGRVWSFRDVTERHRAVASLRESEHKFKTLFETANDAILILNDQVFIDCNQVTEVMYGSPRNKIIGQSPVYFSPKRQADGRLSAEKAAEKIRAALAGTPQFFEWIHARGDGTLFNAEISLNRLDLRGQTVIQAIVRDITARKQAEAAQQDAEQLYRTLVNTSPDGIFLLDMSGRLLYSSPKAVELFYGSADAESIPGLNARDFVATRDRAQANDIFRSALEGKFPENQRLVMRRRDGHEFVAELNGTLLRDSLGVTWGILVITRDITERQRQEDELKGKNTELERFTYTVSHDLRSPLITIKGFAGALLSDSAGGRTDHFNEDLKRIVAAADKMSELLNGLLELSRIGRIVNVPETVSMAKLAEDVLELLAGTITQRQARVTVQPGLPPARGDAQRLQEVLQNLVENALKFSPPGRAPEIEIGFTTAGGETAYFVRDHGCGIEARFHQAIFGLFNKLDPRSQGTGIGLALVRRIVEFHGGVIWVESAGPGEGATFYFTLPGRKALSSAPAN